MSVKRQLRSKMTLAMPVSVKTSTTSPNRSDTMNVSIASTSFVMRLIRSPVRFCV